MAVGASDFGELKGLDEYMKCAKQTKNFEIYTVMFLYIFDNKEKDKIINSIEVNRDWSFEDENIIGMVHMTAFP